MTRKQKNPLTQISIIMLKLIMLSYGRWLVLLDGHWSRRFANPEQHALLLERSARPEFGKFREIKENDFFAIMELEPLL